jgi:hypothetical protein
MSPKAGLAQTNHNGERRELVPSAVLRRRAAKEHRLHLFEMNGANRADVDFAQERPALSKVGRSLRTPNGVVIFPAVPLARHAAAAYEAHLVIFATFG